MIRLPTVYPTEPGFNFDWLVYTASTIAEASVQIRRNQFTEATESKWCSQEYSLFERGLYNASVRQKHLVTRLMIELFYMVFVNICDSTARYKCVTPAQFFEKQTIWSLDSMWLGQFYMFISDGIRTQKNTPPQLVATLWHWGRCLPSRTHKPKCRTETLIL